MQIRQDGKARRGVAASFILRQTIDDGENLQKGGAIKGKNYLSLHRSFSFTGGRMSGRRGVRSRRGQKSAAKTGRMQDQDTAFFPGIRRHSLCGFSAPSFSLFQLRKGCACRYEL